MVPIWDSLGDFSQLIYETGIPRGGINGFLAIRI